MELWVGPAIVAALVSAIVSVIGWGVTFNMSLRIEQMRRDMLGRLGEFAGIAVAAMDASLNSSDAARPIPRSASGTGSALP